MNESEISNYFNKWVRIVKDGETYRVEHRVFLFLWVPLLSGEFNSIEEAEKAYDDHKNGLPTVVKYLDT